MVVSARFAVGLVGAVVLLWASVSGGSPAEPSIPQLIASFADADDDTSWAIARQIAKHGKRATSHLIDALSHPEPAVRRGVFHTFGMMGPDGQDAIPQLIPLISSSNTLDRRGSIYALNGMGAAVQAAIPELGKALHHKDLHTQYMACRALGSLGAAAKGLVPDLIELSADGVAAVRRNAVAALGNIGTEIGDAGLQALIKALADPSQAIRDEAIIALGKLPKLAAPAVPLLEQQLAVRNTRTRPLAIQSIGRLTGKTDRAVKMLADELSDVQTQLTAADILSQMGPLAGAAIQPLLKMTESADPDCRLASIRALMSIAPKQPAVRDALDRLRRDPDDYVRRGVQGLVDRSP